MLPFACSDGVCPIYVDLCNCFYLNNLSLYVFQTWKNKQTILWIYLKILWKKYLSQVCLFQYAFPTQVKVAGLTLCSFRKQIYMLLLSKAPAFALFWTVSKTLSLVVDTGTMEINVRAKVKGKYIHF